MRNANSLIRRSVIRAAGGLSPKVAIITRVSAGELERARSAGMQGDNIVGLEAYSFNDIDLTVRVFVEVVRPANRRAGVNSEARLRVRFIFTYNAGQIPHAFPGMCAISAMRRPFVKLSFDSRRTLPRP